VAVDRHVLEWKSFAHVSSIPHTGARRTRYESHSVTGLGTFVTLTRGWDLVP